MLTTRYVIRTRPGYEAIMATLATVCSKLAMLVVLPASSGLSMVEVLGLFTKLVRL